MKLRLFRNSPVADHPRRPKFSPNWINPSARTLSGAIAEANDASAIGASVKITGSLAPTESTDGAAGQARVKIAGSLARAEGADSAAGQARAIITGSIGAFSAPDQCAASGTVANPAVIDPRYLLLARSSARRRTPTERIRSVRAFSRTRRLIAA